MEQLKKWCKENGYTLKEKIDFDWDRYGDGNVSITTLLKLINDPILNYIKYNHGEKLQQAAEKGTLVHKEAEDFINGKSKTINKEILKQLILKNIKIIETEKLYIKDGVRGTIDAIGYVNGILMVIDYKNSKCFSAKYLLQLGGYKYLTGYDGMLIFTGGIGTRSISGDEHLNLFMELKNYFFKLKNEIPAHTNICI